jgi:hypothetical protein
MNTAQLLMFDVGPTLDADDAARIRSTAAGHVDMRVRLPHDLAGWIVDEATTAKVRPSAVIAACVATYRDNHLWAEGPHWQPYEATYG